MAKYNDLTVGQMEAAINMMGGWEAFQAYLRGEFVLTKVARAIHEFLLEFIGKVTIPATTGKFVTKKKFVLGAGPKAKVKISFLGDNFTKWFLSGKGKIEDQTIEQTLVYHNLKKSSVDGPIIAELGGETKAETTLSDIFYLMEKQGNDENGILLNNGFTNIFYVKDQSIVLRAVNVSWRGGGWSVLAYSVENPRMWNACRRVFSRNSVLTNSET